jgi:hypothetical protein
MEYDSHFFSGSDICEGWWVETGGHQGFLARVQGVWCRVRPRCVLWMLMLLWDSYTKSRFFSAPCFLGPSVWPTPHTAPPDYALPEYVRLSHGSRHGYAGTTTVETSAA